MVLEKAVICRLFEQGVVALELLTGEVQKRIPLGTETDFWALSDTCYMIGPKRGRYQIINGQFDLLTTIPCQAANPGGYNTFIIVDAILMEKGIQITGFEYSGNVRNVEEYRFTRFIDVEIEEKRA